MCTVRCRRAMKGDTQNIGGTETCDVDDCLNNYTPNETENGELRCVTHDPERYDG